MDGTKLMIILGFLVALIVILCVGPLFTIWSLNLLFGTEIPVNFSTYCAVVWIMTVLHGIKLSYKSSN
jgi:hypothetical protein